MPNQSVLPYFILMLLYVLLGYLIVRCNGFYARITSPAAGNRYQSLDGLRGFLALGVFFHHAVLTRNAYATGTWSPPRGWYGLLGPYSVRFFFIITGFLFWSKAIHNGAAIDAVKFWKNRILRIAPMCLFSVLVMLAMAAVKSRFQLHEPLGRLLQHVARCLTLGVFPPSTVNGVELGRFNAYVLWTLQYEWAFYAAFPLLAWFATSRRFPWLVALFLALAWVPAAIRIPGSVELLAFFLLGMAAAHLVAADWLGRFFRSALGPLLAIALLAAATVASPALWNQFALMFVAFAAIAFDSSLFAFLRWPATKVLGTISYSVYLMHAIVLFIVFHSVNRAVPIATFSDGGFWGLTCCCGVLVVLGSAISYRLIEHPFLCVKLPAAVVNKPSNE